MRIEPSISENDVYMPATWRILATLLKDNSVCQADLRHRTGLSHPVVVQQVALLRRSGLIHFGNPLGGLTGRPRIPITFNWTFRELLAVEVHPQGITLQATDLSGQPVGVAKTIPVSAWTKEGITESLIGGIRLALHDAQVPRAGIGIAVPAAIAVDRHTIIRWPEIPSWRDDLLGERLAQEFGLSVFLYNEAEALARARWAGNPAACRSIMAFSLRQNRRVMMTMTSGARSEFAIQGPFGSIGHIPVVGDGPLCPECGMHCLNAMFHVAEEDAAQRPQAVRELTRVMADMVAVFNPSCLVLQGDAGWTTEDTDAVRATLRMRATPDGGDDLSFEVCPYRAHESLVGAASALAGQLLDLRSGQLNAWASEQVMV